MAEALGHVLELVEAGDGVDEHFVGFCSECEETPRWTDLNRHHFVRVSDFCNRVNFITVPEIYRRSLSTSYKFIFVVFSLGHAEQRPVLCLMPVDSFFYLKIVG